MNQNNSDFPYQGTLLDYRKTIYSLAQDLKKLRDYSRILKLDKSVISIEEVLDRIDSNSFSIAVVGEFKRGKSTFINALLGDEILPSNILPCSATLNRVTYGMIPWVRIVFKDGHEIKIGIDELKDYVTKLTPEAEENAANIKEAIVHYPVLYCQNNVEIIDTPGLNDEDSMTEVTLSLLPQVDAAIMVIMAQSPFSEYEREFLETKLLTHDVSRIVFVVTGIDRYNHPSDYEIGIKHIKERIEKHVLERAREQYGENSAQYQIYQQKIGKPKVFGVSAYQALQAKQLDDLDLLARSRFPEFETALETFLVEERGATFLQIPINRAIASATEIIKTIEIRKNALNMKQDEFDSAYSESMSKLEDLRRKTAIEMKRVDKTAEEVKKRVQPIVVELEYELKLAAKKAIELLEIKPSQLRDKEALSQKLNRQISDALQKLAQQKSSKIQDEIESGLVKEVYRLKNFANSLVEGLQSIETQFTNIPQSNTLKSGTLGDDIASVLAVFQGFDHLWSQDRDATLKGAAVGTVGTVGTAVAASFIAGVIGLPISFPVVIAVGVISLFTGLTGGTLSQAIFANQQVANLKESYIQNIFQEIEKQLSENSIEEKVNQQIVETFNRLKEKITEEVESLLDNTTITLSDIGSRRKQQEAMAERENQELDRIYTQAETIFNDAHKLSTQVARQIDLGDDLVA